MIIKNADNKSQRIEMLRSLRFHLKATGDARKRIEQEIQNINAGMRGENEAAHVLLHGQYQKTIAASYPFRHFREK